MEESMLSVVFLGLAGIDRFVICVVCVPIDASPSDVF